MKIYLIAGADMHEGMVAVLKKNGFDIIGHEYTIDAAVVSLKKKPLSPDVFVINGLAQASGATEGVINRSHSMLVKLKEIRMAAPKSRVLLLLPSENRPELIKGVISLGIYDIHQVSRFDEPTLLNWINKPMSIADFGGFRVGQVPDGEAGVIRYTAAREGEKQKPYPVKTLEGFQAGKELVLKIVGSFVDGNQNNDPVYAGCAREKSLMEIARKRNGKPLALLGVGDARIEEWISDNFSDRMDVLAFPADYDELKIKITDLHPDIFILMRQGHFGGIPGADKLVVWAAGRVPAVLFIVGELDDPGREMMDLALGAGVRHIISCEKGGYISGDELVYVLTGIIREMQGPGRTGPREETGVLFNGEAIKKINSLLQGAGFWSRANKQPKERASENTRKNMPVKKKKPKIYIEGGVSLEEETPREIHNVNIKNPTAIVPGGILAVVSPWRPNLAGRLAAHAVKILSEVEGCQVAFIGAAKRSTGAVWLDVPDDELMLSDWRVPGSNYPITQDNISIYPVDPVKDLLPDSENDLWNVLKQARKTSTYTVMDFAGDITASQRAVHQGRSVLLVILPGNDPVELKISILWLRNFIGEKQNVVTGIDLRGVPQSLPEGLKPKVIIRNNPADALSMALRKNNDDEFIWN